MQTWTIMICYEALFFSFWGCTNTGLLFLLIAPESHLQLTRWQCFFLGVRLCFATCWSMFQPPQWKLQQVNAGSLLDKPALHCLGSVGGHYCARSNSRVLAYQCALLLCCCFPLLAMNWTVYAGHWAFRHWEWRQLSCKLLVSHATPTKRELHSCAPVTQHHTLFGKEGLRACYCLSE